jgi:hypothetical protein
MEKLLVAANNKSALKTAGVHNRFLTDSFSILARVTTTSRLSYQPDCLGFELAAEKISELLSLPPLGSTFEELCNERARELRRRLLASGRKYLNVMWSGGIDSTTALISLLKTWDSEELKSVRVLLSSASIEEYPRFYREHVLRKFRGRILNSTLIPYDDFLKESLLVTGELGDQLFGSDLLSSAATAGKSEDAAVRDPNWKDLAVRIFSGQLNGDADTAKRFLEVYEPITAECPHPVNSLHMFTWWWNFTQKWQHVKYRIMLYMDASMLSDCRKHMIHFFDCPRLQRWAIQNPHLKIKNTWESYKWTAKELIVDYTKDDDYRSKRKHASLKKIVLFHKPKTMVTASGRFVSDAKPYLNPNFRYRLDQLQTA